MSESEVAPEEKPGDEWGARPGTTAIVKREPVDVFSQFDNLDDDAIVAELEGRIVESAVYHFNQDGHELWGLSKVGADWAVTELGRKGYIIRDEDLTYQLDPTDPAYMLFTAKVGKHYVEKGGAEAQGETAIGTKRQWTKLRKRDGNLITDNFYFEKGSMKAIRNARLRLIPEETKAAIITKAKELGKVREVTKAEAVYPADERRPTATPPPTKQPPVTVTIKLANGQTVTEPLTAVYHRLEALKKHLGENAYRAILGECGYTKKNEIPICDIPKVYASLILIAAGPIPMKEKK